MADQHEIERLEEALRVQGRELAFLREESRCFSRALAHDLRAPLRGIDGFCHLLPEKPACLTDREIHAALQRICSASLRMGKMIDGLLAIVRLSQAELRSQQVDLSGLAERLSRTLKETYSTPPIDVHVQPNIVASGDPHLLETLIRHALDNALKFSSRSNCARVEVGRTMLDDEVVFFVKDNGVGFDPRHAGSLFHVFERVGNGD